MPDNMPSLQMPEPPYPDQPKKKGALVVLGVFFILLLIGGLITLLSQPQWLKKLADKVQGKVQGYVDGPANPATSNENPSDNLPSNATSTSSTVPTRPEIATLLSEPASRILTLEADLNNDQIDEVAFIAIGNAESKGGEVDPGTFNAAIGVLSYVAAEGRWQVVYQEDIGGVDGTEAVELFQITDLNDDKRPEFIYSIGLAGTGRIFSWALLSSIDGRVERTDTERFNYASYGSQGHNHIALAPGHLVQETFPIYRADDPNCCATGGTQKLFFRFNGRALVLDHSERTK